jgi:hypothetical protein
VRSTFIETSENLHFFKYLCRHFDYIPSTMMNSSSEHVVGVGVGGGGGVSS